MNDKEIQCLSDLKLKAEIESVGKMIDKAELEGVKPTDKVVAFLEKLNKDVERRANPPVEEEEDDV